MSTRRLILVAIGWWLALLVFYLLLVSKVPWPEVVAGSVAALFAAGAAALTKRAGQLRFLPTWQGMKWLVPAPLKALRDCGLLGAALWWRLSGSREVVGVFRAVPFDPGGDDPRSAARRALVIAGITLRRTRSLWPWIAKRATFCFTS